MAKRSDVSAMAFLNMAREYQEAADHLLTEKERKKHAGDAFVVSDPIYFLYIHTVELALKAYLRSHNIPILGTQRKSHNLTDLYEESRSLGLVVGANDRVTIGNIVSLLESGNRYQRFRYFNLEGGSMPDLTWTREVVGNLMRALTARVGERTAPETPAAWRWVFGKPRPKKS